MRSFIIFLIISLFIQIPGNARVITDSIPAETKDVDCQDAIIAALYSVISGPAGQARNWDRMRTLFLPEAKLVATGKKSDGMMGKRVMSLEEYIKVSGPFLEKDGFFENEISRKTDQYGSVVHIFSTYESRRTLKDEKPFMRGINSIQLWFDGKRWWILTVFWQGESTDNPIPQQYLN
ncbi:MAG TPA: hypothetical protein PLB49_15260 [Chitinophagaceae bacterium]|jgi:hypothetical protein|nr:hypothetical protein [Chitinophagaceae bacterium]HPH33218.1 hypothetical protein [Chitinophagaceae bacterium]